MSQMSFSNHLVGMGGQPSNVDLMATLENGGSPAMSSPSSPAQVSQEMSQMKLEDRKVPRPIGTERAWKNYNAAVAAAAAAAAQMPGPGGDADSSVNWMLGNEKLVGASWPVANMSPAVERPHQVYRSNPQPTYNPRIDPDLHQIIESSFQVSHLCCLFVCFIQKLLYITTKHGCRVIWRANRHLPMATQQQPYH